MIHPGKFSTNHRIFMDWNPSFVVTYYKVVQQKRIQERGRESICMCIYIECVCVCVCLVHKHKT